MYVSNPNCFERISSYLQIYIQNASNLYPKECSMLSYLDPRLTNTIRSTATANIIQETTVLSTTLPLPFGRRF